MIKMIPLPHLAYAFSAFFAFLISGRLYLSYRRSKDENLGYFLKTFILLTIVFSLASLPGLTLNHPVWAQIAYILSWICVYLAPFLMLQILCNIRGFLRLKRLCLPAAFLLIILSLFLNILYFSPAKIRIFRNYWYWSEGTPVWLQIFGGAIIGLLTLLVGAFFLVEGMQSREKPLRIRAFLIGAGVIILFLGSLSAYILFPLSSLFVILSGFLTVAGMATIFIGIRYVKIMEFDGKRKG